MPNTLTSTDSTNTKHLLTNAAGTYDAWEFCMHISVSQKSLLNTFLGNDTKPMTGPNNKAWKLMHVHGYEKDPVSMLWKDYCSLLTVELVEQKILNETNLIKKKMETQNSLALATWTGNGSAIVDVYDNCSGEGHLRVRCWHKGGDIEGQYPEWWKGRCDVPIAGLAVACSFVI
ncbi:hypothetical protein ARMGADRAFT_1038412 [Armillaria gallica]|uniref:Uncharacterized protein n=1 Tax=Armillaria gallica TaxID=47427 RepID=A0A2H3D5I8_ARMGA|nr:hypothetical protein ARMGADRAFT_1038412 [Armillaria gallica]